MELSPLSVLAYIHPTPHGNADSMMRLRIDKTGSTPFVAVETPERDFPTSRERYHFSKCFYANDESSSISSCSNEVDELVRLALEGYNAAAVFMSVEPITAYKYRQATIHKTLEHLESEIERRNEIRIRKRQSTIMLDYVYLGITDHSCHNMRTDKPVENSFILEHGLDVCMYPAKSIGSIWSLVKRGSKAPFVLKIRLSDDGRFLGNLVLVDLLQPSIYQSFSKLKDMATSITRKDFVGKISTESSVLARLLSQYLCGSSKALIFLHLDECPQPKYQDDALEALNLAYSLALVKCCAIPNQFDSRIDLLKSRWVASKREAEREREHRIQLENDLAHVWKQLDTQNERFKDMSQKENQLQEQLQESKTLYTRLQTHSQVEVTEMKRLSAVTAMNVLDLKDELRECKIQRIRDKVTRESLKSLLFDAQSDLVKKDIALEELQKKRQNLETLGKAINKALKESDIKAKEAERRAIKAESRNNKKNKDLQNDLVQALTEISKLEQMRTRWVAENDLLKQRLAGLEVHSENSQSLSDTVRQLQSQLEDYKSQVNVFKSRAELVEARWQESVEWNARFTSHTDDERNKLRICVQQLREQASQSVGDASGSLDDPSALPLLPMISSQPELTAVPKKTPIPSSSQPLREQASQSTNNVAVNLSHSPTKKSRPAKGTKKPKPAPVSTASAEEEDNGPTSVPVKKKRKLTLRKIKVPAADAGLSPVLGSLPEELFVD